MLANPFLLAGAVAVLADAAPPTSLAPAGHWTVEYNAGNRTLPRSFCDPARPIFLGIKPIVDLTAEELVPVVAGSADDSVRRGFSKLRLYPAGNGYSIRGVAAP
jgi:hypothetical protein